MNLRRYIGALIFFLTLVGVVSQQQSTIPNQELVLEFTDADMAICDTQNTVTLVKTQLQNLGAENIQIVEDHNGKLKITYYSDTDVAHVKEALSKDETLAVNYLTDSKDQSGSSVPLDDKTLSYSLDIYEITKDRGTDSGFGGKSVLSVNHKSDRSYVPDVHLYDNSITEHLTNTIKTAYKVSYSVVLTIEEPLHCIPEVRAGPIC